MYFELDVQFSVFKKYNYFRSISFQLIANIKNNPDNGEETDRGNDFQAIGNFESSNERWRLLQLKNEF